MSDPNDVEKFLREMDWCKPSTQLDERVAGTVRKPVSMVSARTWWVAGAAAAIAAVVTLGVLRAHSDQPDVANNIGEKKAKPVVMKPDVITTQALPSRVEQLPVVRAAAKPVRIERVVNTFAEDDVQDSARRPYVRQLTRQVREVIWIDANGQRQSQMLVPEGEVEVLRYDMY